MKKYEIVKEKKEFNNLIKNASYIKNEYYVIYHLPNEYNYRRFGIAISTKFGKANIRNFYKRRLRTIIDQNKKLFPNKEDYIIMIKRNCYKKSYKTLNESFMTLLKESFNEQKN